jgi:hypothetical protein
MMHSGETFLAGDWHESTRNVGGVLAAFVRQRFPRDTIKQTAKALNCTLPAAANVTKGHASERTLTKAFQVWPWELAQAVGEAFSGRTYADELQSVIEQEAHEQAKREAARDRVRRLEKRAAELVALHHRPAA